MNPWTEKFPSNEVEVLDELERLEKPTLEPGRLGYKYWRKSNEENVARSGDSRNVHTPVVGIPDTGVGLDT